VQLENSFTVPAPPNVAWDVLLDIERVAPCMPGATLTSHDGDDFAGTVKVKVGPIQVTYRGTASFVERDDNAHAIVIDAKGRETRGSGTANAKITCKLLPDGEGTRVDVVTDLSVTGKPAQFGRGVMAEVAGKVIAQFADGLAEEIGSGAAAAAPQAAVQTAGAPAEAGAVAEPAEVAAAAAPQAAAQPEAAAGAPAEAAAERPAVPTPPPVAPVPPIPPRERRSAEAIDLLDVAGAPVAKRLMPIGIVALILFVLFALRRRRH
jgi:carbon monoxide dehydrogenase subunit G